MARMELELPGDGEPLLRARPARRARSRATAHYGRPRVPPAFAFAPWNDAIFGSANVRARREQSCARPARRRASSGPRTGGAATGRRLHRRGRPTHARRGVGRRPHALPGLRGTSPSDLHAEGFKWLVYFNSFVEARQRGVAGDGRRTAISSSRRTGRRTRSMDAKFNPASMVDLTQPGGVRRGPWARCRRPSRSAPTGGWGTYGEWLPTDAALTGGSGLDLHNGYSLLWQKAQRQALDRPSRPTAWSGLSFVRSGWLGTAPLADVFWAGDQRTDFEVDDGLPTVVPIGIGVGLSGVSTFGSDIAGYQSATNPTSTKELFFRWTELGAWSPVMRTHHGTEPKLEWNWQSDDGLDGALGALRDSSTWRSRRTMRGLAQAAHDTGVSHLAPARGRVPRRRAVVAGRRRGDGRERRLLVAPVQVTGRDVAQRVPAARHVVPWSGGASVQGGTTLTAQAPVDGDPGLRAGGHDRADVPRRRRDAHGRAVRARRRRGPWGTTAIVYAFAGAPGSFAEAPDAGGLSYTLAVGAAGRADVERGGARGVRDDAPRRRARQRASGTGDGVRDGAGDARGGRCERGRDRRGGDAQPHLRRPLLRELRVWQYTRRVERRDRRSAGRRSPRQGRAPRLRLRRRQSPARAAARLPRRPRRDLPPRGAHLRLARPAAGPLQPAAHRARVHRRGVDLHRRRSSASSPGWPSRSARSSASGSSPRRGMVGGVVALALTRELAPVLASVVVTARAGQHDGERAREHAGDRADRRHHHDGRRAPSSTWWSRASWRRR